MVFNQASYFVSTHAVKSYIKRTHKEHLTFEEAKTEILNNLHNGQIFIENENYRYVKHEKYYYPCRILLEGNKTSYLATTTLTRKMVESGEEFDELLEKYSKLSY